MSPQYGPLTLLHSSLIAVEQRVQPGAVVHHKHAASGPLGGHASFPLDVQGHLNRQPSLTLTAWITSHGKRVAASSSPRGPSGCQGTPLTGLVWTVDSSSNLTVAEVMTLMMSSHVWPKRRQEKKAAAHFIYSTQRNGENPKNKHPCESTVCERSPSTWSPYFISEASFIWPLLSLEEETQTQGDSFASTDTRQRHRGGKTLPSTPTWFI